MPDAEVDDLTVTSLTRRAVDRPGSTAATGQAPAELTNARRKTPDSEDLVECRRCPSGDQTGSWVEIIPDHGRRVFPLISLMLQSGGA